MDSAATLEATTSTRPTVEPAKIVARYQRLVNMRQTRETEWDDALKLMMPRRADAAGVGTPAESRQAIFDDTAIQANNTLAAGLVSALTPATDRWAALESPAAFTDKDENAKVTRDEWYQNCTESLMKAVANSNFHTEIHETHLARNIVCTAAIGVFEGEDEPLIFKHIPPKTFVFTEDVNGRLTSFYRKIKITIENIARQFGHDSLPEEWSKLFHGEDPSGAQKEVEILHAVEKRMPGQYDPQRIDSRNKPFASAYITLGIKQHVLSEGGYDDMPYCVGRFLKWGSDPWGYGPGVDAMPTVRQLNFLEEHLDALAEQAAFPRILAPSGMKGKIDLAAAGITTFDPNQPNARPFVWGTEGRADYAEQRMEVKKDAVRKFFHNDLFQMLGGIEPGKMTAYETMQRFSEKLDMFSPSYKMVTTEILQPLMKRAFSILFRRGMFAPPPPEVFVQTSQGYVMPMPQIAFVSRLALAIRSLENRSFVEFMQIVAPMLQIDPNLADNFNLDAAVLGLARNLSVPTAWTNKPEDRDAMRAQRAQAAEMQSAMMQATQLADSAGKLGKAPPAMQEAAMKALGPAMGSSRN